jgi:ribonuclease HI
MIRAEEHIAQRVKADTRPEEYHRLFHEVRKKYKLHVEYHVDASFSHQRRCGGIGIFRAHDEYLALVQYPEVRSCLQAEVQGIQDCIEFIYGTNKPGLYIIYNDSQQAIRKVTRDYLPRPEYEIIVAWVPGHIGIMGNRIADSCAKIARRYI